MFDNKMKAVTFSYDDGVFQDKRLIRLFNKYNVKATFNINSGLFGKLWNLDVMEHFVPHVRFPENEIRDIYEGHEIAGHSVSHAALESLGDEEFVKELEDDRLKLSELAGYEVVGMAYPGGQGYHTEHYLDLVRNRTGFKYGRTTHSVYNFDLQTNLVRFNPSVYHLEWDKMFELAETFVDLKPETPKLFYVWGHAYELDYSEDAWEKYEEFLKLISGRNDIFYGTNKECLLDK